MKNNRIGILLLITSFFFSVSAQNDGYVNIDSSEYLIIDSISILNGSFESFDENVEDIYYNSTEQKKISGWQDFGFSNETPASLHEEGGRQWWGVTESPQHGQHFLSMVTRANDTYEGIYQMLDQTLQPDQTYFFSLHGSQSKSFKSPTSNTKSGGPKQISFKRPITFRIWNFDPKNGPIYNAHNKLELLYESEAIDHQDWKKYSVEFVPKKEVRGILIEAFFKTPAIMPYFGHILLDNVSSIYLLEK